MQSYLPVVVVFLVLGLGLLSYFRHLATSTHYRPINPDDPPKTDGREEAKGVLIKKITRWAMVYIFACALSFGLVWIYPKVQAVRAALGPTATQTPTIPPSVTPTQRMTRTPTPSVTAGPTQTGAALTSPATGTPTPTFTTAPTSTARVVAQNVPVTVVVTRPVTVFQTVIVPQTVVVYQTVVVIVTPTYTATLPATGTPTSTPTATETPSPTPTLTETPTETPTP